MAATCLILMSYAMKTAIKILKTCLCAASLTITLPRSNLQKCSAAWWIAGKNGQTSNCWRYAHLVIGRCGLATTRPAPAIVRVAPSLHRQWWRAVSSGYWSATSGKGWILPIKPAISKRSLSAITSPISALMIPVWAVP